MTPSVEVIVAADIALTRLISLVIDLINESGDEETIEKLKAEADAMDERRSSVMKRIRAH